MTRTRTTVVALACLGAAVVLSLCIGSRPVPPLDVWQALLHPDPDNPLHAIVSERVPRTLIGLMAGAALALAGAGLQGVARNPLADPGLLGVNAGAATAVVIGVHWFGMATASAYVWMALAGAAFAAVVVYLLASLGRDGATPTKLVLAGAAATAGLSSLLNAILVSSKETLDTFRFWQVGSIGGRGWGSVATVAPFLAVGAVVLLASARSLNAIAIGDDLARGLGSSLWLDRLRVATGVVLLCGAATALAGPIAFVGLMVPHALRMLGIADYRMLLPMSLVAGGALLLVADTIGRVVAPPAEMQVGIMTALLGVPVFVWVVRRGKQVAL